MRNEISGLLHICSKNPSPKKLKCLLGHISCLVIVARHQPEGIETWEKKVLSRKKEFESLLEGL